VESCMVFGADKGAFTDMQGASEVVNHGELQRTTKEVRQDSQNGLPAGLPVPGGPDQCPPPAG
jgi:hypothetical protein